MSIAELPYVEAELNYLKPMAERPRYYAYEAEPGEVRSNMTADPHRMHIHDMRPIAVGTRPRPAGLCAGRAKDRGHGFLGR